MAIALTNGRVLADAGFERGLSVVMDSGKVTALIPDLSWPPAFPPPSRGATLVPCLSTPGPWLRGTVHYTQYRGIAAIGAPIASSALLVPSYPDHRDLDKVASDGCASRRGPGRAGCARIHLEGPFLTPIRGHSPGRSYPPSREASIAL